MRLVLYARIRAVEGRPGHPPADPRVLLALWLHATIEGVGSARALARLCAEHVAFQWPCGGVSVSHKTLSDSLHGPRRREGQAVVLWHALAHNVACLWRLMPA